MDLTTRITNIIVAWPQWSRAERRHLDAVINEILHYCRTGEGNTFIREWCTRNLSQLGNRAVF